MNIIRHQFAVSRRGFSLIEVLLAVAVMSFGLLALASLQLSLMRTSGDAKAQSVALSLAKDKLEDLRGFGGLADYLAVTDGSDTPDADPATTGNQAFGGIAFTRSWTVSRFAYDPTAEAFEPITSDTAALTTDYVTNNEFKRLAVEVTWKDPTGADQKVIVDDLIAAVAPSDSALLGRITSSVRPRGPEVLISNPGLEEGVIPIALGTDSATAATNPKPEVVGQGKNSSVVETRFDVLTYSGINSTNVLAQQRVETVVVGCQCTASAGTQPAFRPTYWNGFRYLPPVTYPNVPISTAANNVTQSARCSTCCRDHHDPVGAPGPKFDARRSTHSHFLNSNLTAAVTSGAYSEACRLIRVDGVFRTAVDMYNDAFNFVETDNNKSSTTADYLPTTAAKSRYETFVLDYLKQRYVNNNNPSSFNTALNNGAVTTLEANPSPSLNTPTNITINNVTAPRWLHARGLYIDHLTPETLQMIADVKTKCAEAPVCDAATLQTRVLSVLPFTSINLTEISFWNALVSGTISDAVVKLDDTAAEDAFLLSATSVEPVKGKVSLGSPATSGSVGTVRARIGPSNSGLALEQAIDPGDDFIATSSTAADPAATTDLQQFTIGASVVVPNPAGGTFNARVQGAPEVTVANNSPYVGFVPSGGTLTGCAPTGGAVVNPYSCTTSTADALGGATVLHIGNYNRVVSTTESTVQVLNTCTSNATDRTPMPYLVRYDVTSVVSSNGTATFTPGTTPYTVFNSNVAGGYPTGEYTTVTINPINGQVQNAPGSGDLITVTLGNKQFLCPSNFGSFNFVAVTNGNNRTCTNGNGSVPIWSTTYTACTLTVPSNP